jgi:uncharacterized Tic20 family protein
VRATRRRRRLADVTSEWAERHPTPAAVIAWYLAALPGVVWFLIGFWSKVGCRDPWLGSWFALNAHGKIDEATAIAAAAALVCVTILRVLPQLGANIVGGDSRSLGMISVFVALISLFAALLLVLHGALITAFLGPSCT